MDPPVPDASHQQVIQFLWLAAICYHEHMVGTEFGKIPHHWQPRHRHLIGLEIENPRKLDIAAMCRERRDFGEFSRPAQDNMRFRQPRRRAQRSRRIPGERCEKTSANSRDIPPPAGFFPQTLSA